jgi:acetyl esterase/lipase
MKTIISIVIVLFFASTLSAQRYLNPVFANSASTPNIVYGQAINVKGINQNLLFDLYQPAGDTFSKRPLLIYAHGGGFSDTNQTKALAHIIAYGDSFARRGYVVASIDYRLDSVPTGLSNRGIISAMHDAKAAVRYFKRFAAIFKIDTNLIFFGGESAGAITALNTTYINQTAEVLFPLTPPFSSNLSIEGNSGHPGYTSNTKASLCFCGGTNFVSGLPLFDTNAINVSTDPPVLFVHGTADPLIPIPYALNVAIRATHLGIPNLFYTFNGASHCPWLFGLPNAPAYLDSLVQYTSSFLYAIVSNYSQLQPVKKAKATFLVYPNPLVGDRWTISQTKVGDLNSDFSIYNATGLLVMNFKQVNSKTEIDVSKWSAGIYIIRQSQAPFSSLRLIKAP